MRRIDTPPAFDPCDVAGVQYSFPYRVIQTVFTREAISAFCETSRTHHRQHVAQWSSALNTEWVIRHYSAVKMLLSATVMVTSSKHAETTNLQIVLPYLSYYSVLSCARALLFTDPTEPWDPNPRRKRSHQNIIHQSENILARLDKELATDFGNRMRAARDWRELFSYKFPATGPAVRPPSQVEVLDPRETVFSCRILAELAELHSQLLYSELEKASPQIELDDELLLKGCKYEIADTVATDQDDWYRLDYIRRKMRAPGPLDWTATEGLAEDFFGSWCAAEELNEVQYNPDEDWFAIFPFN